ncbi:hypothetical protein [Singulisphaera sp. PoT]|uniref:hypothetical protein n=1 Tax=Singulisphaera sp. PoT TaxID=3411797 RepID=UPI003BF56970
MAKRSSGKAEATDQAGVWIKHGPPKPMHPKWRKWMESSWVSPEGDVFIPANFGGSHAVMSALADSVPMMTDSKGVTYLPIDWMIDEEKDAENLQILVNMRNRIREMARLA